MAIKKGDFIEIDYTGKVKDGEIFDTTEEKVAKDHHLHHEHMKYGPVIVVIGENHLIPGLDDELEGKELGKYHFELPSEKAFGKKSADLLKLIPARAFAKQEIKPFVGLEVNMDGLRGTVRNVAGGRIIVDFNHPLASRDVVYDITVKKIVTDNKERIQGLADLMRIKVKDIHLDEKTFHVHYDGEHPKEMLQKFEQDIERLIGLKQGHHS
ncbi:peptidylprolyl isomerase [Candidatus Woesearchaeota archaeon]|nr:MAG: peptidylprolyl isomerase [Candidatus Woesearchaeota archaeon]